MAISRMISKSVAEARDALAEIVHDVESGHPVQITRRGKRVAVLISAAEFDELTRHRPSPWDAIHHIRERITRERIDMGDDPFENVRDESPGRRVNLR
jgi:prevent-host-death family protein